MGRREVGLTVTGIAVMSLLVWLISFGGHLKVGAQLDAAADSGDDSPVTFGDQLSTGTCPGKWVPHIPAGAHLGRHRMYHHPQDASPNMTAAMSQTWRFCPPSEGDL